MERLLDLVQPEVMAPTPVREQAVEIAMLLRLAVEHLLCVHALRQPGGEPATVRNATALLAEIEAVAILVR